MSDEAPSHESTSHETASSTHHEARTHLGIDRALSGAPMELGDGLAKLEMPTTATMVADEQGLVHGGFVFSLADHAAMLAVNHPNVVLGSASVRFLRPVRVGETLMATARVTGSERTKRIVAVTVERQDTQGRTDAVCEGEMICFVLERHVLDASL